MALIKIIKNGEASYYYSNKDHKKLSLLAEVVNEAHGTDIEIECTINPHCYVPVCIKLEDTDLRYFDIRSIFEDPTKPSKYTIDRIAKECAFNEDYCNFICDMIIKLAENFETAEIAENITERITVSILSRAVEILSSHKDFVTKAFYKAKSCDKNSEDWAKSSSSSDTQLVERIVGDAPTIRVEGC